MIKVAVGNKINYVQEDIVLNGHSIECRINAEDPKSFAPWPGKITDYHAPGGPGVRIDSMVYSGYTVPTLYDSMIAKLITHGKTRDEALARMRRCLSEMKVDGIRTNIEFHQEVLEHPRFISSDFDTGFLSYWKKDN